jgi:hypothetical protein
MGQGAPSNDWKAEFQKLNATPQTPVGQAAPGKHPRFALYDAKVKLYRRGATSLFGLARLNIEGTALNLSEDGTDLITQEQLLPDTKVHLRLEIAKFEDRIESDGVVRWCHKDPKAEDRYTVSVEFAGSDASLARKIAQMKGWFTSPQGLAIREQRIREERKSRGLPT